MWIATRENLRAFAWRETAPAFTDQIHTPFERVPIDHNTNPVAITHLPDRPARKRLWPDVTDARAGGDAGETRVRHQRDMPAEGQMFECGSQLVSLLHARAEWSAANEHHHVACLDPFFLERGHRLLLVHEHTGRTFLAVNAVGVNHARIDRRALDDRAFGRKVAARKCDRAGEAARAG